MFAFYLDPKVLIAITAIVVGIGAFIPYFSDIFKKKTTPHAYTWLIWLITQGTATAGIIYGNGGLIGYGLILGTGLVFLIFLLSLKYGTKNITLSDILILCLALIAIVVWWQLHNPVLAVFMVGAIDAMGYIPTYRKLYIEPWSESLGSWFLFSISYILSIASLREYNLLTVPYLSICLTANLLLVTICIVRRRSIPKPATHF